MAQTKDVKELAQTKSKSSNKFDSFRIANIKNRIWGRSYEIKYFSLKTEIPSEFLRFGSKLMHSIIADRKKELLKKLCFVLIRVILLSFLVAYDVHFTGMRWKRYFGCSISENFIKETKFPVPATKLEGLQV